MTEVARPTKRRISRMAIALTIVSFMTGAGAIAFIVVTFLGSLTQPSFRFPGTTTVHIEDPGTYALFELTGTQSQNGPVTYTQNHRTTLRPADVTITGPHGDKIAALPVGGSETLQRDGEIFTASIEFEAATPGSYTVEVDSGSPGGSAVVARELGDHFASIVPWMLASVASGLVFAGSAIALIVSAVRAGRANRAPPSGAGMYPAAAAYGHAPGPYGQTPGQFGQAPGPYAPAPGPFGPTPGSYEQTPGPSRPPTDAT